MLREVKGLTLSDTGGKCGVRVGTLSCSTAPRPQNVIGEEGERRGPSPSSASLAPTSSPPAATTVSKARGRVPEMEAREAGAPAKEEASTCKAWTSPTTQYTDGKPEA